MTTGPAARSAASLLAAGLCATVVVPLTPPVLAMSSPWWEHYEIRESFLCRDRGRLVVERNDAQASLISGGSRATLFRETSSLPGVRYGDDNLRLILKGDELTVERLPQRFSCFRTDQA